MAACLCNSRALAAAAQTCRRNPSSSSVRYHARPVRINVISSPQREACRSQERHAVRQRVVPRATDHPSGAPAGQITSELISSMRQKISEALEVDLYSVEVLDRDGDGRHVSITAVSPVFEGKSEVARQRMVYKAIWLELQDAVHAVDEMQTRTPAEASS
eukprot:CAMPEP_0119108934 /NCGR_PEP_ID=MMETSP1180-20130426/16295_1 /TAXON_ID=3052 ORGANISM="Chlamydomonas cf sp, Strain CCMP681" /NCGR_SAMPLE_ID=MMETSP1180 /ASSEMBLY_ACC=CAM_ASM_000741 /LENGTH=159 /DNA_ID=CAMNT_0007094615 /DNA_START=27 /DNA_END=506 /DNA_ORIENTATION=+